MKILVTGGTGYIGSHTIVELIKEGFEVVVYDNLSNSSLLVLERIFQITKSRVKFIEGDMCDAEKLNKVFNKHKFNSLHFLKLYHQR